jgi:hypothetical protein
MLLSQFNKPFTDNGHEKQNKDTGRERPKCPSGDFVSRANRLGEMAS